MTMATKQLAVMPKTKKRAKKARPGMMMDTMMDVMGGKPPVAKKTRKRTKKQAGKKGY